MSAAEEKEQAVGEEEHAEASHEPEKPGTWEFVIPIVSFFPALVVCLIIGWIVFPAVLYSEKEQPIDFSHAVHVEAVDDGCESCHYFREDGSYSGIPKLENCMECHEEPMGEHPEEARLIKEYIDPAKEIPWLVYSLQPDCVFFSHAAHVKMAEIECIICHGPVGDSDHTMPYQYNLITGYSRYIWGWNIAGMSENAWERLDNIVQSGGMMIKGPARMKMDDCGECHREMGTSNTCFICHK